MYFESISCQAHLSATNQVKVRGILTSSEETDQSNLSHCCLDVITLIFRFATLLNVHAYCQSDTGSLVITKYLIFDQLGEDIQYWSICLTLTRYVQILHSSV